MGVPTASARAPRLVLRFAFYTALALLLAGLGILWFVRHEAQVNAERTVLEQARLTVGDLGHHLTQEDFRRPAEGARLDGLDQLFADELTGGIVRVGLWSREGVLTYSNEHARIGARNVELDSLRRALGGTAAFETRHLEDEDASGVGLKVLVVRLPVTLDRGDQPVGVLELARDYSPVAEDVKDVVTPVGVVLALALLALYAALFPILRQVTRALEHRNRRLVEQAAALARSLAERKLAEESLGQAEEQYRTLVEKLPLVTYVTDGNSTITYVSQQVGPLLGLAPEALVGGSIWRDRLHPDDREPQLAAWRRWLEADDDETFRLEYRLVRPDGKVIWVDDSAIAVRDGDGRTLYHQGFLLDITERKRAEGALRGSEERFRTLVANVPGVIFRCAVDEHWTAEFLSDAIEELTGYPASEFIGNRVRTFGSIFHPEDADRFTQEIHAAIEAWRPYVIEYRIVRRDGEVRWVLEHGQAVISGANELSLDGVMFDVTETRAARAERERLFAEAQEAREALAAQNERLLELDRLKDEFIALVSHELRTPLTSIRGYLELLLEGEAGELNEEQVQFLAIVERNSHRLLHLVGDLLFLAQVEAGKLALEVEAVDLAAVASESVETVRPLAEEKGITLTLATGPVPLFAGDAGRMAQLLDNLLSNALKFTPAGGRVDVRVQALRGQAVLEVRDTGMGIPAAEQERLFERFFRSSVATQQAIPGTGLGLAISKAVAEAHGGTIRVTSEEGAGTTFRVSIPIGAEAAAPQAEEVAL